VPIKAFPRPGAAAQLHRRCLAAFALLSAAACDVPVPPEPDPAQPPPAALCAKVRAALETLARTSTVQLDGQGGATIPDQVWIELGAERRGQLGNTLAYDAACRSGRPQSELTITFRNETGRILSQRTVSTRVDMSELMTE